MPINNASHLEVINVKAPKSSTPGSNILEIIEARIACAKLLFSILFTSREKLDLLFQQNISAFRQVI